MNSDTSAQKLRTTASDSGDRTKCACDRGTGRSTYDLRSEMEARKDANGGLRKTVDAIDAWEDSRPWNNP